MPPALVKVLNRRWILLGAMLVMTALGAWFGWSYVKTGPTIGWKTSQFFFSYQDLGFVSRGLVATLLHPCAFLLNAPGLIAVTLAMLGAFAVVWWRWQETATRHLAAADRAVLALVGVLAPSTFLRMGFDYGRFDPLNLTLTILALACLLKSRDALAALLATVAVLVHEGFLVLHFPLLVACVLVDESRAPAARARRLVRFAALPAVATVAVLLWGKYEPGIDALAARFEANALYRAAAPDHAVNRDALLVITRTLRDNLDFNAAFFAERKPWGHLAFIGAWLFVFARFFDGFYRRNGLARDWLYCAAYSPLLMSAIACDYFRWAALASVNLLLVVLLKLDALARRGRTAVVPWDAWARLAAASCLFGPISNTKSFPFFFTMLEKISPWPIAW